MQDNCLTTVKIYNLNDLGLYNDSVLLNTLALAVILSTFGVAKLTGKK
jgi:hypothetical protein